MIVETHNKLGSPQRIECTRAVIRDIFDSPIALMIEHAPGQYFWKARGDEGFERALRALGINETVVTEVLDTQGVKSPPGELIMPE